MAVAVPREGLLRRRLRRAAAGPRYPAWLALPAGGWYAFFVLAPLTILAVFSVCEVVGYGSISYHFNLGNYRRLWDPLYGKVFLQTLELAAIGTLGTALLGFPLAYYLARFAKRKGLLLLLVVVPFWTSFLIRTYAWLIILDPGFPLFRGLGALGIHLDLLYKQPAVYLGVIYTYLPLMVLPLYATLERMDWKLVDAAQDLGDSPFGAFRRVTLPLVRPGLLAGSLLVFIPMTGEYLNPVILGGGKSEFAGNLITQEFLEARDWPFGSAVAMVLVAGLTVAIVIYNKLLARAEQYGG
jgi:spermidine/putrescine transport system permease protein